MYTYHQYKTKYLPTIYNNEAKEYWILLHLSLHKKINDCGKINPGHNYFEFDQPQTLFELIEEFTKDKTCEWHIYGKGESVSECVEHNKHVASDFAYGAALGIIGYPR